MGGRGVTTLVEDDTTLMGGIMNLATDYFDTTSVRTQHGSKEGHFSFQTVKGQDWNEAVGTLLKQGAGKTLEAMGDRGKDIMKTVLKGAVNVAEGEVSLGAAAIGFITDMIVDHAETLFKTEQPVQEKFEPGTWVYIERAAKPSKLVTRAELASETSMFGDSDEVLTRDTAPKTYTAGFYVNQVSDTNDSIVYCYDTEEPQLIHYTKIREARAEDKKAFDSNESMTLIRELFFLRENRDNIQYAKFQIGDEVIYQGEPYSCLKATGDTITLQDSNGNLIDVDPQACTKGETDHWRKMEPTMFATARFTLSLGELAYRPIVLGDKTTGPDAQGILTCIKELTGDSVVCVDAWTGDYVKVDAMALVKPPIPVRRLLEGYPSFHTFKRHVLSGTKASVNHDSATVKSICYGEGQTLDFPAATHVRTELPTDTKMVQKETIVAQKPSVQETNPPPVGNEIPTGIWVVLGAGAFMLMFL